MTTSIAKPLNSLERTTLRNCEKAIEKGCKTFVEVGNALLEIRDGELYRETHKSFKAYCRDKWGFEDSRARQLIGGAERAKRLESVTAVTPEREWQTRPLAKLPEDQQADAWADAVEEAGGEQPTAAQVQAAVDARLYTCPNCGGHERDEDGDCASCREPTGESGAGDTEEAGPGPARGKKKANKPVQGLTGAKREAWEAREQIKVWHQSLARWLPSIDKYREKWPGPDGDAALGGLKAAYEALKKWERKVK